MGRYGWWRLLLIPNTSLNILDDLLARGALSELVGLTEGSELEAKEQPYDLDSPSGMYELLKDVSAFANRDGGYLLIGPVTQRRADAPLDVITSVNFLPEASFPVRRYQGLIIDHIFPKIAALRVELVCNRGADEGIGVIYVPRQDQDRKPFLIFRVVEAGETQRQIVFGYAERNGDRNEPMDGRKLQQRLQHGGNTVAQRLTELESRVQEILDHLRATPAESPQQAVNRALLKDRVRQFETDV